MPRAVFCEICGQMFFPASLKIHQKSCRERQSKTITECPHCGMEMPQADLDDHLRKCKKALEARAKAAGEGNGVAVESISTRLPDGRVACQFCGRGFAANRVTQHQQICGKLKQARPRGRDGAATQLPEKVYDGQSADFAPRDSDPKSEPLKSEHRSSSAFGTPKPATQPSSSKKSPSPSPEARSQQPSPFDAANQSSRDARGAPSPASSEADPDGWRAKHREFLDAIRNARRAKASPWSEASDPAQARTEADPPPTPPVPREKPAARASEARGLKAAAAAAKAAVAEERRRRSEQREQRSQELREQRDQRSQLGDWEAASTAALSADLLSPQSTGREAGSGPSLSPVLRRASAPEVSTPAGSQSPSGGFPGSPSSRDERHTPGREDGDSIDPMCDWIPGDHVQVQGLLNARELNGQMAVLLDFDLDAGCWLVRLENGGVKAMRSEHMTKQQAPSKTPSIAEGTEPPSLGASLSTTQHLGTGRSPSPNSRALSSSTRGPSPVKRNAVKSLRPSASVGPRRLKAMQTPEPAPDAAGGRRPPKAPRSSSAEPRRTPCDSPRPRRSENQHEVQMGSRLAETARAASGPGKQLGPASLEDDSPSKETPSAISRSIRSRRSNEVAQRACSKAASVPYIGSVPEDSCPSPNVPSGEFAQTPKERSLHHRGFGPGRGAAKAVAAPAGQHEGGDHVAESPLHGRRTPSESPRMGSGIPEAAARSAGRAPRPQQVMEPPAHPPLDSPLASKSQGLPENTDGIDERLPASEPPFSGRADTASTAVVPRTASSLDTGSSTPLSARAVVPATIQLPPQGMQGQAWTAPLQASSGPLQATSVGTRMAAGGSPGYAPATASTAPAAMQAMPTTGRSLTHLPPEACQALPTTGRSLTHLPPEVQQHPAPATFVQSGRHTLTPSWGGAGRAAGAAAATAVAANMEAMANARASTRQLHTPAMTPSAPTMGPAPGPFMAPHPPASLCLYGGSAQLAPGQPMQHQACAIGPPPTVPMVQQPHPMGSPVIRAQPRRAA